MDDAASLPAAVRQQRIVELIARNGFARVSELSGQFRVTAVTIRADLALLEAQGLLTRVHGGATRPGGSRPVPTDRPGAGWLDGELLDLIDGCRAVWVDAELGAAVATALAAGTERPRMLLVTNDLDTARQLESVAGEHTVSVTGGVRRPGRTALVDPGTTRAVAELHLDLALLHPGGISADAGLTDHDLAEAEVRRAVVGRARRRAAVVGADALGRSLTARIADVAVLDVLVVDDAGASPSLDELADAGVPVHQPPDARPSADRR